MAPGAADRPRWWPRELTAGPAGEGPQPLRFASLRPAGRAAVAAASGERGAAATSGSGGCEPPGAEPPGRGVEGSSGGGSDPEAEARALARRIVEEAEAEACRVRARAERELAEARSAAEELVAGARRMVAEAQEERRAVLASVVDDIAALSLELARRLVMRELSQDPEAVMALARALLERCGDGPVALHAHPADAARLRERGEELGPRVRVVADPAVAPGGLVASGTAGQLDATWETRWRRAEAALVEVTGGGR
jgi:flagellar assembly protein FliH